MILAFWKISGTVIIAASDVPLTRSIATLLNAGIEIRAACGRIMYHTVGKKRFPNAYAASHCPALTPAIDPRYISPINALLVKLKQMTAAATAFNW